MKASELAELLNASPNLDVTYLDEWGVQTVTSVKLVKIKDDVQYDNEGIKTLRDSVAAAKMFTEEEYEKFEWPPSYENYSAMMTKHQEEERELLVKLEAAPYSILLK